MAAKANTSKQQVRPGALFGVPGITRWTYQQDNNYGLKITEASSGAATTPFALPQGIIPLYQTDVAFGWKIVLNRVASSNVVGSGGTGVTNESFEAPYNYYQNLKLTVNKLYSPIDVYSSYELTMYNFLRPMLGNNLNGSYALWTAPIAFPANAATNPFGNNAAYTFTAANYNIPNEWPVSLWMDEYFDLDMNGNILGMAHRLPISPLYMSGEARIVTPSWQLASEMGANADTAPWVNSGAWTTNPVVSETFTFNIIRQGIYASNNLATMPPVYNWRLSLTSRQYAPINYSRVKIPLRVALNPGGGQLLLLMVRLFDPALGANATGGPVPLATNVTNIILTYGSGIVRYQDTVTDNKERLIDQHGVILPDGTVVFDLAIDDRQRITNARALNMYLTDVFLEIDFGVLPSANAYAIIFAETFSYVIDNVAAAVGVAAM